MVAETACARFICALYGAAANAAGNLPAQEPAAMRKTRSGTRLGIASPRPLRYHVITDGSKIWVRSPSRARTHFCIGEGWLVDAESPRKITSHTMVPGSSRFAASDGLVETAPVPPTRPRNAVPRRPVSHDSPAARIRAVARAFKKLESRIPGLVVGIKGSMTDAHRVEDPERGIVLAFRPEPGSAEVQLQVGPRGGRLVARSALRGTAGGVGELEDHLRLDLRRGFRWGGIQYPDAEAFTTALVAHMRRRQSAVGQVEPVELKIDAPAAHAAAADDSAKERVAQELFT